jgi:hypothetical protein
MFNSLEIKKEVFFFALVYQYENLFLFFPEKLLKTGSSHLKHLSAFCNKQVRIL